MNKYEISAAIDTIVKLSKELEDLDLPKLYGFLFEKTDCCKDTRIWDDKGKLKCTCGGKTLITLKESVVTK